MKKSFNNLRTINKGLLNLFMFLFFLMQALPVSADDMILPWDKPKPKEEVPDVEWIVGPEIVDLGRNMAQLEIDEHYVFADAKNTRKYMKSIGNPPTNLEVGLVMPNIEDAAWFLLFQYFPTGYVKDDEKDTIDSDAILEEIKKGTEEANKIREEKGYGSLDILGWHIEPRYDEETNNLIWSLLADEQGYEIVNFNTRLLGRYGYMSAVLVADKSTFGYAKPWVDDILENFSYKDGKKYFEYVEGDSLAKFGLSALIAGGAGVAATKMGLLKLLLQGGKFTIAAVIGLLAFIGGIIKSIFGRGR